MNVTSSILDNYSIYNGQYYTKLWFIYDFILSGYVCDNSKSKSISAKDFTHLICKYKETLDLMSPHCISPFIRCSKNFFRCNDEESQRTVVSILNGLFDFLWDMRDDAKNFNEAYGHFLAIIFAPCVQENDSSGIFKQFLLQVYLNKAQFFTPGFLLLFSFFFKQICETLLERKEEKPGMSKPLAIKALQMLARMNSEYNEGFIDILISFLTFGDLDKNKK